MRSNPYFFRAISISEIVRTTAAFTLLGAMATPLAAAMRNELPRPAPSAQPSATPQDVPAVTAPVPATPAVVDPAAPSAPVPAAQPQATPVTAATPTPQPQANATDSDPRTVVSYQPNPPQVTPPSQLRGVREGRRTLDDKMVKLAFKDASIPELIPFIYEWTGKYVSYKTSELSSQKVTLVGDREIPKSQALDYIFQSLKVNGLAVTETEDMIHIGLQTDLIKTQPGVVLGPEEDVMLLPDNGLFVTKVFRLRQSRSTDVLDRIEFLIPEDYAKLSADGDSNQIILSGDIGLAKKVQTLINMLDVPAWDDYATETFRLQFQDASAIKTIIEDLFADSGSGGGRTTGGANNQNRAQRNPAQNQPGNPNAAGGGSELIVTVLASMNSITVRATPDVLTEIRRLVASAWDLPPNSSGSIFRVYDLKYADPSKVRDLLSTLLGGGGGSSGAARGGQQNRAFAGRQVAQGGSEGSPVAAVEGIFSIEAYPDSNRLVVISKTPENYEWLDRWIEELDQPFDSGLPVNVPLKHAGAVELSEILNTLLAASGSEGGGMRIQEEGIEGLDNFNSVSGGEGGTGGAFDPSGGGGSEQMRFPWQGARAGSGAGGGAVQEVSALIGRSRVVPNPTQNSVLVMAPPEVEKKVIEIINQLDKPGRQVLITAVLAEVKVGDGFSWGARVGSNLASPLNGGNNSVSGSMSLALEKGDPDGANFASPWFDSSTLEITTGEDMSFALQALSTDNSVRILQQPRVFTSDNKEAKFQAGQDVSLLTGETSGFGTGGTTQNSYSQTFVGVGINVRPRITQDNNVNMEVEILLSNLSASTASFNQNPVIDRRQTNTHVTVKNGQCIVISGIRREQETIIDDRIPFLGDIPGIGSLFSSTQRQKDVVELVVFLVPLVVENPDANDTNFNQDERSRLKLLQEPLEKGSNGMFQQAQFFEDIKNGKSLAPPVEPALEPINEMTGTDVNQKGTP